MTPSQILMALQITPAAVERWSHFKGWGVEIRDGSPRIF
jgi:hypothetical protein